MNVITTSSQNAKDYASRNSKFNNVLKSQVDHQIQANSQQQQQFDKSNSSNHHYQQFSTSFAKSYLNPRLSLSNNSCYSSGSSSGGGGGCGENITRLRNVINQSNYQATTNNHNFAPIASIHRLSSASSSCSLNTTTTTNNNKSHHSTASRFANNMIAKLSAGGSLTARQTPQNSAQSKRKRSKLLDILLNSNWSKQNQQSSNLMKLNKILLVCDANFLDEKTGESPISLAIGSSQINSNANNNGSTNQTSHFGSLSNHHPIISCPPQSASLFNITAQSTGKAPITRHALQQTNISDLSQSKAPLIERILLLLVKSGALIDFQNSDGRTPLHVAAMKSNFWALKTLLELEASTDYRDINGLTPLYYSILHKADLKVTQLLLNYQNRNLSNCGVASTNSTNASRSQQPAIGVTDLHGWQELHQACKLGLDAHLEKLLYYGCDIDGKISGSGNTPLHVAAINDQLNCAKVLLMRGADKTITNNSHQTAYQMAVISNNMDLAEFIAEHNESKVIPFRDRPANFVNMSCRSSSSTISSLSTTTTTNVAKIPQRGSTRSSSLANSHSWISDTSSNQPPRATVLPQIQQTQHMNPLSLDVTTQNASISAASSLNGSSGFQSQSFLPISGNQQQQQNHNQLNVRVNNISPCLSQRSCATSNTTSSSGVCCDGDGSNSAEELHQNKLSNSLSQHSNITIIAINKNDKTQSINDENEEDEDLRSSGSSSNDLYSLMSEERPLFAGTIVEATSDYQSGDPSHLRLRRGDLIEVLEYTQELIETGQLPRLANKPMLYGCRRSDGLSGLFPSFCVHRAKHQKNFAARQRLPLTDILNPSTIDSNMPTSGLQNGAQSINGTVLPEHNSSLNLNNHQTQITLDDSFNLKSKFREIQVTLTKTNEGFGFVLRGAKVDPSTFTANGCRNNKFIIDEKLMAANNLVSLQYLDEIEPNSVASRAGLNRGDFLVAVNNQDVRLKSHEQVVQMIRQSGDQVHFKIATPLVNGQMNQQTNMSKTLGKVKPEPPKRDPTTTLTRNRAQRVKSMLIQPFSQQQQPEQFDANKPLPMAPSTESPMSPTGSLNMMNRSVSTNLSHFHSAQSLSSATNTQSISSVSTIGVDEQQQQPQQQEQRQNQSEQTTPTHSSSSTATLTTVATISSKPKAPPKPVGVQINLFGNQSTTGAQHQPAVIHTATRRISLPGNQGQSSPTLPNATITPTLSQPRSISPPLPPPPPPPLPPTSIVPSLPIIKQELKQTNLSSATLASPPPPPPLPNFSTSPICRMSQRRTSAPTVQTSSVVVDSNHLINKRESVAIVSQLDRTQAPVPAQFGAVAAACAAAANNRLQRQQKQKQEESDNKTEQHQVNIRPANEKITVATSIQEEQLVESKPLENKHENSSEVLNQTLVNLEPKESLMIESSTSCQHQQTRTMDRKQMSATLGRKSSAQIIQQPKTQLSQTLRGSKPKRASILNYDELPPPPPPLNNSDETAICVGTDERHYQAKIASAHQHQHQKHHHHHHQHNYHATEVATLKQEYNQQQHMQSLALHQQQVIKQQLRHQQLLQQQQQQQQQLILEQQAQLRQRMCLAGGKHGHEHYGHIGPFVDLSLPARGQHLHESYHQQPVIEQQVRTAKVHPQHHHHHHQQQNHHHNHHSHHPHPHPHHHHNHNHQHEKLVTGVTQQQYLQHQHHHQQQQQHQHLNQTASDSIVQQSEINQPAVQNTASAIHNHNHNHNYIANQSQQLYQRLQQQQQQQLTERYLPMVYSTDTHNTTTRES